jgi:hypothetical protein
VKVLELITYLHEIPIIPVKLINFEHSITKRWVINPVYLSALGMNNGINKEYHTT